MGFIKFVFVLLIVVPIAVLMIYLVNNLNEKIKTSPGSYGSAKKPENKAVKKSRIFDKKYEQKQYPRERTESRQRYTGPKQHYQYREAPDHEKYKRETPYYKKQQEKKADYARDGEQSAKSLSKRKRRKERKNKRKVREK